MPGAEQDATAAEVISRIREEMAGTNAATLGIDDLPEILRSLAARARDLVRADYAAVSTFDETGVLNRFVHVGMDDDRARELGSPPVGRGLLGMLARRTSPLRFADLREAPGFTGWPEGHPDMCAFLGVPIVALGQAIGSLYMTRTRGAAPFSSEDEWGATLMALQISATVSAALARHRQARMDRLQERVQIAHDLHDGVIQSLYGIGLEADAKLKRAEQPETRDAISGVLERVRQVIKDTRAYIGALESDSPDRAPELLPDLAFVVRQMVPPTVEVVSQSTAPALHDLSTRDVEDLLFIAREALSNAVRHGAPTKVELDLHQTRTHTVLAVRDNGSGFDPATVRPNMGSVTMRTRAERLGATLEIETAPGAGTLVRVTVPRRGAGNV